VGTPTLTLPGVEGSDSEGAAEGVGGATWIFKPFPRPKPTPPPAPLLPLAQLLLLLPLPLPLPLLLLPLPLLLSPAPSPLLLLPSLPMPLGKLLFRACACVGLMPMPPPPLGPLKWSLGGSEAFFHSTSSRPWQGFVLSSTKGVFVCVSGGAVPSTTRVYTREQEKDAHIPRASTRPAW